MSQDTRVVLVTGSNRGIGYEIVKQLCWLFDGDVILTARNDKKGMEAVKKLQAEGLDPKFIQLDISSTESIQAAKKEFVAKYGKLDVLINNAGVCINAQSGVSLAERAPINMQTNFYGTKNLIEAFLPLMKPNGRIVNMGSESANMFLLVKPNLQAEFTSQDMTLKKLMQLMDDYVETAKTGNVDALESKGWPGPDVDDDSYSIAEVGKIVLSQLIAKQCSATNIDVVGVVPGWVKTEMGTDNAPDPPEVGAISSLFATLLPPGRSKYHGLLINKERDVLSWERMKQNYEAYYLDLQERRSGN